MKKETFSRLATVAASFLLVACSGGSDSGSSTGSSKGSLSINSGQPIAVQQGSYQEVKVSIDNGTGVSKKHVVIKSDDPSVTSVSPDSCVLSTDAVNSNFCLVKVHGHALGQTKINAVAEGYGLQAAPAVVSTNPSIGTLQVLGSDGSYHTGTAAVTYNTSGSAPYNVTVTGQLSGSSGIDSSGPDTAYITYSVSSSGAGVAGLPNQCQVTTQNNSCSVTFTVNSGTAAPVVTANVAGGALSNISAGNLPMPVAVSVSAASTPTPPTPPTPPSPSSGNGTITIATQSSGTQAYAGINMPLFVNWTGFNSSDTVPVGLVITPSPSNVSSSSPVQFYSYTAGVAGMNKSLTPPTNCSVTNSGGTATNCAYGLWVDPNATLGDSVIISAPPVTTALGTYTFTPFTLTVAQAAAPVRTVTFTNNSTQNIYVGITGGGGWSYKSPTQTSVPPGTPSADIQPGAVSSCGPNSNYTQACPMGSTCAQAGAVPAADTPFYCYYDQNAPDNGYEISANGGSTTLKISGSAVAANGMIWSGNFFGRAGVCDPGSGQTCPISCNPNNDGGACGLGTGASPGIATLSEVTFNQAFSAPDYYDVSIINGVNLGVSFGPKQTQFQPAPTGNSYNCGVAGTKSLGASSFSTGSSSNLPNATWQFAPTSSNFPPGAALNNVSPASYYRYVIPSANSKSTCTKTSDCTSSVASDVCGYSPASINSGKGSNYANVCGAPVAWITADSIWGFNQDTSNSAPFMFTTGDSTSPTPASWTSTNGYNENVGSYQLCVNQTYSGYLSQPQTGGAILACGGVMWGNTQGTLPTGAPSTATGLAITYDGAVMQSASTNWLSYVLPTITWLKQACPTCYTYPFDDKASTFTCSDSSSTTPGTLNYEVKFTDVSFQ